MGNLSLLVETLLSGHLSYGRLLLPRHHLVNGLGGRGRQLAHAHSKDAAVCTGIRNFLDYLELRASTEKEIENLNHTMQEKQTTFVFKNTCVADNSVTDTPWSQGVRLKEVSLYLQISGCPLYLAIQALSFSSKCPLLREVLL